MNATHTRNLTAADYDNLRNYYAHLLANELAGETAPETVPDADRAHTRAADLLRREDVMADKEALTLALRHGSDAGQYDYQLARNRAEAALTADVTATALAAL